MPPKSTAAPWTRDEFEQRLRAKERFYHIHHPFHVRMNSGQLEREAVRGWVANRFYYQISIPVKDAAVMANCRDRDARRLWVQRIIDHDGSSGNEGGIEAWLQLGEAVGLTREALYDERHVLPGVRFAVDAYVNFARAASFEEAACSSLTELFAPTIHQKRLDNWPDAYPWIEAQGYNYFRKRLSEARRDVQHGLAVTLDHFTARHEQDYALNILQFKLDILWTMLDAMWMAYIADLPPFHSCPPAAGYGA
ncbi:MAG: pyrroloquinoline-quinone synthase PqqC [Gammaproteobacteria bacterium]|nr:pyrroloquinoline-quinone synthase PqqC [Gammaproteobacteria bacterium]MCP5201985.1 pyrroloquinoline-quinone synthase PqqC [Gammaproteobacteria bacterium]